MNIPAKWPPDYAYAHLTQTFDQAAKAWPENMEPFVAMLVDTTDATERMAIMREGLRSTILLRGYSALPRGGQ